MNLFFSKLMNLNLKIKNDYIQLSTGFLNPTALFHAVYSL